MTLRLPEPLPYDFVDQMIDDTVEFQSHEWTESETVGDIQYITQYKAITAVPTTGCSTRGNVVRGMFQVVNDSDTHCFDKNEEGREYLENWFGGQEHIVSEDLPDEELDMILDGIFGSRHD